MIKFTKHIIKIGDPIYFAEDTPKVVEAKITSSGAIMPDGYQPIKEISRVTFCNKWEIDYKSVKKNTPVYPKWYFN